VNQLEKPMQTSNVLNKKLSIIIVNYKSKDFLEKCIISACKKINSNIPFEFIIVNNDTVEKIDFISEKYSNVKIINNKENVGFGAGNNIGAKEAQGEFILFLNPDAEIISNNLENVFKQFSSNEKIGALGSGLLNSSDDVQVWSSGLEINLLNLILNNLGFLKSKKIWESKEKVFTDWVSGAAMFTKRSFFKEVGGFDEDYFMYFEDMDFCRRIRENGQKVLYFPEFQVKHMNGKSYNSERSQKKDYYNSQEKYFKKHYGNFSYYTIKLLGRVKFFLKF